MWIFMLWTLVVNVSNVYMFLMMTLNIYLSMEIQKHIWGRIFLEISIAIFLNWKKCIDSAWYDKSSENPLGCQQSVPEA